MGDFCTMRFTWIDGPFSELSDTVFISETGHLVLKLCLILRGYVERNVVMSVRSAGSQNANGQMYNSQLKVPCGA